MKAFLFEVETNESEHDKEEMERKFIKEVAKLPILTEACDATVRDLLEKSLYFAISLLEIYIKKNTRIKRKEQRVEVDMLGDIIKRMVKKYSEVSVLCKRLYMIVIHLKLHNLNTFSSELSDQTIEYLDMCIKTIEGKEQTLLSYETVVVLLYNCLKIMLGFN